MVEKGAVEAVNGTDSQADFRPLTDINGFFLDSDQMGGHGKEGLPFIGQGDAALPFGTKEQTVPQFFFQKA